MHKGIRIYIKLSIEGEAEPADDFAISTIQAIQEILNAGLASHPELKVSVRDISEDTGSDDDL